MEQTCAQFPSNGYTFYIIAQSSVYLDVAKKIMQYKTSGLLHLYKICAGHHCNVCQFN
jgi:hypothetical protein